jgi:hypothetical protein
MGRHGLTRVCPLVAAAGYGISVALLVDMRAAPGSCVIAILAICAACETSTTPVPPSDAATEANAKTDASTDADAELPPCECPGGKAPPCNASEVECRYQDPVACKPVPCCVEWPGLGFGYTCDRDGSVGDVADGEADASEADAPDGAGD